MSVGTTDTPPSTQPPQLGERTLQRVRAALEGGGSASLAQVVALVSELSGKASDISIQELAELINKDVAIMAKVLAAANTVAFNPWGTSVTTVAQAIQVVGFNRIRDLALALMLFEKAEGRITTAEHREVAALALASGLVAQQVSNRLVSGQQGEEAFVCAALRNYGRLLMALFLTDDYRKARHLAAETDSNEAYRKVFGLTPLELSHMLMVSHNLPETLLRALKEVPAEVLKQASTQPAEQLLVVSDFAVKLCETIDAPNLPGADLETRLAPLLKRYQKAIGIQFNEITPLLRQVQMSLSDLGRICGVESFRSSLAAKIVAVSRGQNPYDPFAAPPDLRVNRSANGPPQSGAAPPAQGVGANAPSGAAAAPSVSTEAAAVDPALAAKPAAELLLRGLSTMADILSGSQFEIGRVYQVLVQCVQESLQLQHCVLFVQPRPGTASFVAEHGLGSMFDEVRRQPVLNQSQKDIFNVCLSRGDDVVIENAEAPQIAPFVPNWLKPFAAHHSVILLPLRQGDRTYALLCGISRDGQRLPVTPGILQHLKLLRSNVTVARQLLRLPS